jgi:4-hydroxyphenylacetate 3-monooxygenase
VIRTGEEYRASIRDGREVWIDGERVEDVPSHPAFKPLVDIRARIYDLAHEPATQDAMTYLDPETGERCAVGPRLPRAADDWRAKRRAVDTVLDEIGGVVTRVGDETVGEMWSLYDGQDVLNEIDPRFSANIRRHVLRAAVEDPFHVSANTDPKGDRSKRPQDQDPDMLLHVARETDGGIVVRGAKFETAAAYANQAFVKPTIANWGRQRALRLRASASSRHGRPGMKHICRSASPAAPVEDYPLSNRVRRDRHPDRLRRRRASPGRTSSSIATPGRKPTSAHPPPLHPPSPTSSGCSAYADLLIGAAHAQRPADRSRASSRRCRRSWRRWRCYREGINAHLTAAIARGRAQPRRPADAEPELLYTGRVLGLLAASQMMHVARDLIGGQVCVTPNAASFRNPELAPLAGEVLHDQRAVGGGGPPRLARLCPRPGQLRLRRPPPDVPALRPVAALRPPPGRLPNFDFDGAAEHVRRSAGLFEKTVQRPRPVPNGKADVDRVEESRSRGVEEENGCRGGAGELTGAARAGKRGAA